MFILDKYYLYFETSNLNAYTKQHNNSHYCKHVCQQIRNFFNSRLIHT